MRYGIVALVLMCGVFYASSQYYHPGGYGPVGFGFYPKSFGHGHFQSPKAYPPLPKKKFTIADELKYGPKFNPRPFPKPYGQGFSGFLGFTGFFPIDEGFFEAPGSTQIPQGGFESTQRPQGGSGSSTGNWLTAQASVTASVSTDSNGNTSTSTTAPPGSTTEDEDKVVAGGPDRDCGAGQERDGDTCREAD